MRIKSYRITLQASHDFVSGIRRLWLLIRRFYYLATVGGTIYTLGRITDIPILNVIGFLLGAGGLLLWLRTKIRNIPQNDLRIPLNWTWYVAMAGILVASCGGLIATITTAKSVGEGISASGFDLLVLGSLATCPVSYCIYQWGFKTTVMYALTILVVGAVFPPLIVYLTTNGSYLSPLFGPAMMWRTQYFAGLFIDAVPIVVFIIPDAMSRRLAFDAMPKEAKGLLLGWIAFFAAASTAAFGVLIHFSNGQISKVPFSQIIDGSLLAAILLYPFYKQAAGACWRWGIVNAPTRWLGRQHDLIREIKDPWRQHENTSGRRQS